MLKTALITGSGRDRIGNLIARGLADDGYAIGLHYHNSEEEAHQTRDEIRAAGCHCDAYQADVGDEKDVQQMFSSFHQQHQRIDLLVTTASIWKTKPLAETTADDVLASFQVNTLGTFLCAREAGLQMAEQETGGSIIVCGDWAIQRPYPGHAAYFIAKGAIPTLTKMLAVELAALNPKVRVNCIHPGPVMFPPGSSEEEKQEMKDSTLVKTAGDPDCILQAVRFLASNPFMTGACIPVDGGRSIYAGETRNDG